MSKLTLTIHGTEFRNPILGASGTVGFGRELAQRFDWSAMGGLVSKAVTPKPRRGNLAPRIAETPQGMLNSVGLENPGLAVFQSDILEEFSQLPCRRIINLAAHSGPEYVDLVKALRDAPVDGFELNLSCPNVADGLAFGSHPGQIEGLMKAVRRETAKPVWVKLTPNVTSIADCARAAEAGGADGISLINTLLGMAIDIRTRRPILHNNTGGLSGPAVKPVALRMVHEVYRAVEVPIIGLGGISCPEDVVEFILAGASLVQAGTLILTDPAAFFQLPEGLSQLLDDLAVSHISQLRGQLRPW